MSSQFTLTQLQAIKAAINGNATAAADIAAGNPGAVAGMLNAAASPQVMVWIPNLAVSVMLTGVVWSDFVALTQGQRDAWRALTSGGTVDATNANVRAGFTTVFGSPSTSLTNLANLAQRPASWLESIFTTGGVSSLYGASASADDVVVAMKS